MPDEKKPEAEQPEKVAPTVEPAPSTKPAPEAAKTDIKTIEFEDYTFEFDAVLLDDVELLEMIDAIEGNGNGGAIVRLIRSLIGQDGYDKMKTHFVAKDGRFKMSKLFAIYGLIFEDFDPKGSLS